MNHKQKRHVSILLTFIVTTTISAFNSYPMLQKAYLDFEQQLIQNNPAIQFLDSNQLKQKNGSTTEMITRSQKKQWTFIVYIAADNDLRAFAANNIKQMASIGSNSNLNILVHMDIRLNGNQKITRRYYVEKGKINHMNHEPNTQRMDSGDPKTLISCCEWAIRNYPAQNYALILWNHGTGIIDPKNYKIINPAQLFTFNPETNKFELDRATGFLDLLNYTDLDQRGICWDNTTGNYLTNQKLDMALNDICTRVLRGKFDLIAFDACLMSMLEVANLVKKYANIMIGSQEVELGTGWNYAQVLQPLSSGSMNNISFARHIVDSYKNSYHHITNDFTQSAIDPKKNHNLKQNPHTEPLST